MPVVICIYICLVSHLSIDKDFTPEVKQGSIMVMGVLAILYILFGLVF